MSESLIQHLCRGVNHHVVDISMKIWICDIIPRLLISKINKSGPRTDLCGIPFKNNKKKLQNKKSLIVKNIINNSYLYLKYIFKKISKMSTDMLGENIFT